LPIQVNHQVRYSHEGIWKPIKVKSARILKFPGIEFSKARGYFDGASQGSPGICGSGDILYLSANYDICFKAAFGQGSNNRAELCALWVLLNLALDRGVKSIQILADSKLAIDWANGVNKLEKI